LNILLNLRRIRRKEHLKEALQHGDAYDYRLSVSLRMPDPLKGAEGVEVVPPSEYFDIEGVIVRDESFHRADLMVFS